MSAMSDLIEDWIQIRSTLQRQLKTLESNQDQVPVDIPDEMREMTVNHIKETAILIIGYKPNLCLSKLGTTLPDS